MESIGLPVPTSVSLLGQPWMAAKYHLQFGTDSGIPDVVLRRILHWTGTQPFETESAAIRQASFVDDVPVCSQYRILSRKYLPWPAAVHSYIPGQSGQALIEQSEANEAIVASAMGTILARLNDSNVSRFGTRIDAGHFAPTRSSWKAEWRAITGHFLARLRAHGVALQPAVDELVRELNDHWDALDSASEYCLIHGDLKPSNLLFIENTDTPQLSGIIDWEGAMAGDALVDWALPVQRAGKSLIHLVKAYDPERVREFLAPEIIARLHIYTGTRCLAGLAHLHSNLFYGDAGARRAWILEWMRIQMRNHSAVAVKKSLSNALDGTVKNLAQTQPKIRLYRIELWQTLEALRFAPLNTSPRIEPFLGALSACFIARDRPERGVSWRNIAQNAVRHLGPQVMPFEQDPIPNREAWKRHLIGRVLNRVAIDDEYGHCLSIAAIGFCFAAFDELDWTISDGHLRGLETLVEGLIIVEEQRNRQAVSVQTRLTHGVLGWAALSSLKETHEEIWSNWDHAIQPLELQMNEAWNDLIIHTAAPQHQSSTAQLIRDWPHTAGLREAGSAVPSVLWALQHLMDRKSGLPAGIEQIWVRLNVPATDFADQSSPEP